MVASFIKEEKMDKKILVTRSSMPEFEEYVEMIKPLWGSHWITNMGMYHNQLQEAICSYSKVDNISLFVNGHMALELLIQAMGFEENTEVITTPFTFASTTHAIVRNRLKPVFCDIKRDDFTIDVDKIESLITDKTVAILPVHVYGNVCDIEKIKSIADKYNLKVIYDAAHTFGETYKGLGVGAFGDASIFSFHATKVFNTIEGGAVAYSDPDLGEKLYKLKNFGIASEEVVNGVGANAKMNEFQAAMGLCNLKHLETEIDKRKHVVEEYRLKLCNIKGVRLNKIQEDVSSNYSYFPIVMEGNNGKNRDGLYDFLMEHGIYSRKYFYPLTNAFECYKGAFDIESTPVAYEISKKILTLPLYADLTLEEVDYICELICSYMCGE